MAKKDRRTIYHHKQTSNKEEPYSWMTGSGSAKLLGLDEKTGQAIIDRGYGPGLEDIRGSEIESAARKTLISEYAAGEKYPASGIASRKLDIDAANTAADIYKTDAYKDVGMRGVDADIYKTRGEQTYNRGLLGLKQEEIGNELIKELNLDQRKGEENNLLARMQALDEENSLAEREYLTGNSTQGMLPPLTEEQQNAPIVQQPQGRSRISDISDMSYSTLGEMQTPWDRRRNLKRGRYSSLFSSH